MPYFLFKQSAPLLPGQYLLGHLSWPVVMELQAARLTQDAHSTEKIVLVMVVNGLETEKVITVTPRSTGTIRVFVPLRYVLAANSEVRWKCKACDLDSPPTIVGLNLLAVGVCDAQAVAHRFWVQWVNGLERLTLFTYDPATRQFLRASPGIPRASIQLAPRFSVRIQEAVALRVAASQVLSLNQLIVTGGVGTSETPRLEFFQDNRRLATLTKDGTLRVLDVEEDLPQGGGDRFELYGDGELAATLGRNGLVAQQLEEVYGD